MEKISLNNNLTAEMLPVHTNILNFCIPFKVKTLTEEFILFAVWTKKNDTYPYIRRLIKNIEIYRPLIDNIEYLIIEDVNASFKWDYKHGPTNHSRMCALLGNMGIKSLYHEYYREKQEMETMPTYYHRKVLNSSPILITALGVSIG